MEGVSGEKKGTSLILSRIKILKKDWCPREKERCEENLVQEAK